MTTPRRHTIMLVDAHPIWRQGVASVLSKEPDLEVCAQVSELARGEDLIASLKPDLLMADFAHEAKYDIGFIKEILCQHPGVCILVLSVNDECLYAERMIRAGAKGYLMKQECADVLVMAVRQVLRGGVYLSTRMRELLLNKALSPVSGDGYSDLSTLTDREIQVFTLLGNAKANREIARHMQVSVKTVDAYRAHIKSKLKLRSGLELIRLAVLHTQPYSAPPRVSA